MSSSRAYQVLVTNRKGHVRQVERRDRKHHPAKDGRVWTVHRATGHHPAAHRHFTVTEAHAIRRWFQARHYRVEISRGRRYPWIILNPGAHWPGDRKLLEGMNAAARDVGRRIKCISGKRTQAECWQVWRTYQRGGPLAASPNGCGGHCCSNHFTGGGRAADSGWITSSGNYLSVGLWRTGLNALSRHNISLAVPSEPWHLEFDPSHSKRRWRGY